MMTITEYALDAVCAGAEGCVEDDMNESGEIAEENHQAAIDHAYQIIWALRRAHPDTVLDVLIAAFPAPANQPTDTTQET